MRKKQPYREYATEAFRLLGREGSKEKYIQKLIDDIRKSIRNSGVSNPTETEAIRKDQAISENAAILDDLEAAHTALYICGEDVKLAVELVYMKDCWKELEKGDIETRVRYAEIHIPSSRMTIYRSLRKACREFAKERGLRI
jgi:hypothetical protein